MASVFVLGAMRVADAPVAVQLAIQALLVVVFSTLTLRDYRLAVTLAMIELATAGAGGRWTVFPGGIPGRIALDAIVFVGAIRLLFQTWSTTRRLVLGRYGRHAIIVTGFLLLIWAPLGLLYGNRPSDVFADADGYAFIAFVIVFIALLQDGQAQWIRNSLLVACAFNAVLLFAILMLALAGITPLYPDVRAALQNGLGFEGAIGIMPSGAWRFYLPTDLYLQVGMVLVAWRLLRSSTAWLWALYAVLMVDLGVSYTRGLWICTGLALAILFVLGARELRPAFKVIVGTAAIFMAAIAIGLAMGFSVLDYLGDRASSSLSTLPIPPGYQVSPAPGSSPSGTPSPGIGQVSSPSPGDELGEIGNQVRVEQAKVLIGHILDRPVLGSGFGAIAPDYLYGNISRYEISFLDLAYKTGLVGAAIFLSLPLRLLWDGMRGSFGRLSLAYHVSRREASVPVAIIASILAVSVTNPYLFAAYGLLPILISVAWLDPLGRHQGDEAEQGPYG